MCLSSFLFFRNIGWLRWLGHNGYVTRITESCAMRPIHLPLRRLPTLAVLALASARAAMRASTPPRTGGDAR